MSVVCVTGSIKIASSISPKMYITWWWLHALNIQTHTCTRAHKHIIKWANTIKRRCIYLYFNRNMCAEAYRRTECGHYTKIIWHTHTHSQTMEKQSKEHHHHHTQTRTHIHRQSITHLAIITIHAWHAWFIVSSLSDRSQIRQRESQNGNKKQKNWSNIFSVDFLCALH